jgi:hypothetical protein
MQYDASGYPVAGIRNDQRQPRMALLGALLQPFRSSLLASRSWLPF